MLRFTDTRRYGSYASFQSPKDVLPFIRSKKEVAPYSAGIDPATGAKMIQQYQVDGQRYCTTFTFTYTFFFEPPNVFSTKLVLPKPTNIRSFLSMQWLGSATAPESICSISFGSVGPVVFNFPLGIFLVPDGSPISGPDLFVMDNFVAQDDVWVTATTDALVPQNLCIIYSNVDPFETEK